MDRALIWAAGGTLFLLLMTTLGAATVFLFSLEPRARLRRWLLGFAAGVMTAASVWSLLLPAMERAAGLGLPPWLPAGAGLAAGALFLWALDAWLPRLRRPEGQISRETALLVTAITLHNIPEGMAVGLSCALAAESGIFAPAAALALGIGVQNFPEGAAVSLPLRQEGLSRRPSPARWSRFLASRWWQWPGRRISACPGSWPSPPAPCSMSPRRNSCPRPREAAAGGISRAFSL